ncbi:MAG TPA: tRNA (adenosine(37)-N6)-threonylcarbamoyltransferase complex ATPase subunit type 1 TsaE [Gammaproteobacteria bacterium]
MTTGRLLERYDSEAELVRRAGEIAAAWDCLRSEPLLVGLEGELGSGKTTWVRGALAGLGHVGRVPSPTYTLVEHYPLGDLSVVHVDLYRLADATDAELEALGLRDWLDSPATWIFVEWSDRSSRLAQRADLTIRFESQGEQRRTLEFRGSKPVGVRALESLGQVA